MGSDRRGRRDARRRAARGVAHAALLGWIVLIAGCDEIRRFQRDTLFQPRHTHPDETIASRIPELERWWLDVEDGQVEAWYLPPPAQSGQRAPAVIFAHGNRELIEEWPERLAPYRAMGFAILLPEYRSYGRSGGVPGEAAILGDFSHFYDRLVDRPEIDGSRVVFHGRSLGGGVMGVLSSRRRCAALILESTFTNVPDLASQWTAPEFFITDRFDTRDVLMHSATPTLILHGVRDELVPIRHARELERVAWDARLLAYPRAGHNDLPRTEAAYWRHVRAFLEEAGVRRAAE